jgi:hypothetical protein
LSKHVTNRHPILPIVKPCPQSSPHLTNCQIISSPHLTNCQTMTPIVIPSYQLSNHVPNRHPILPIVKLCHQSSPHLTNCQTMSPIVTPSYQLSNHDSNRHPILPIVKPCHQSSPHLTNCQTMTFERLLQCWFGDDCIFTFSQNV